MKPATQWLARDILGRRRDRLHRVVGGRAVREMKTRPELTFLGAVLDVGPGVGGRVDQNGVRAHLRAHSRA